MSMKITETRGRDARTIQIRSAGKHWLTYRLTVIERRDWVKVKGKPQHRKKGKRYFIVQVVWWIPIGKIMALPRRFTREYKHLKKKRANERMKRLVNRIRNYHKKGYTSAVRLPRR